VNQFNWTYLGDNNKQHHIGLMHGAESGHLMVYFNSNIVLIDFKILESKTYTFFIEDELCELNIERKDDQFLYGFVINKNADTPLNRQRKKIEKRHLLQSIGFIAGLVFIVLGFTYGLKQWNKQNDYQYLTSQISNSNHEVSAKVLFDPQNDKETASYFYLVNGKAYKNDCDFSADADAPIILENGMPLEPGDEFYVKYLGQKPHLSKIDYNRPSDTQLNAYRERAINKYLSLNPNSDPKHCTCMVDIALEMKGVKGLADIYFLDTSPADNPKHNKNSFLRLTRDIEFERQVNKKCNLLQ